MVCTAGNAFATEHCSHRLIACMLVLFSTALAWIGNGKSELKTQIRERVVAY
jgi:hypothetical protein